MKLTETQKILLSMAIGLVLAVVLQAAIFSYQKKHDPKVETAAHIQQEMDQAYEAGRIQGKAKFNGGKEYP